MPKVALLEEKYSDLFSLIASLRQVDPKQNAVLVASSVGSASKIHTATFEANPSVLDTATLLRASEILAQEVHLDRLLRQIMELMLENAGAEHGTLLLKEHDVWEIQAHGSPAQGIQVLQRLPLDADLTPGPSPKERGNGR